MTEELPILLLENAQEWAEWLEKNPERAGAWVRIAKKGTGIASITYDEAVEVGLCYGWIDGLTRRFDHIFYIVRFTPRRPKGNWTVTNRAKAELLIAAGKMTPRGLEAIENAKANGRWPEI